MFQSNKSEITHFKLNTHRYHTHTHCNGIENQNKRDLVSSFHVVGINFPFCKLKRPAFQSNREKEHTRLTKTKKFHITLIYSCIAHTMNSEMSFFYLTFFLCFDSIYVSLNFTEFYWILSHFFWRLLGNSKNFWGFRVQKCKYNLFLTKSAFIIFTLIFLNVIVFVWMVFFPSLTDLVYCVRVTLLLLIWF